MRTECTQIAITAPLLRRVIAPPRLGVVFIAVLLEDHEQVVDVVLLLVLRVSSVGLLVRLQVEFRVVRALAETAEGEEAVGEAWEDLPMEHRMKFAAYVLRKESRWKEIKPSIITRYEQARVGEVPDRCEGRAAGQQTKAQLLEKVKEVCQSLHKVNAVKRA